MIKPVTEPGTSIEEIKETMKTIDVIIGEIEKIKDRYYRNANPDYDYEQYYEDLTYLKTKYEMQLREDVRKVVEYDRKVEEFAKEYAKESYEEFIKQTNNQ